MKYIFIAGLEHSGTTLINHVLSQHRDVIGLGEVAPFFSRHHMTQYMARWGEYADARLCSCGETWERCPFWGGLIDLNGLNSNRPILEKYHRLVHYIRSHSMAEPIVVDSSKSYSFLRTILDHHDEIGLGKDDISVILSVKDVRSFATSIAKKQGATSSLLSHLRTFNWWVSENKKFLNYLNGREIPFDLVLYEKFCVDPEHFLRSILEKFGVPCDDEIELAHNGSHIATGNNNFLMGNRKRIRYDIRWFLEDNISLAYLIHHSARTFNKELYRL